MWKYCKTKNTVQPNQPLYTLSRLNPAACGLPSAELHSLLNEARWWFGRHKDSIVLLGKCRIFFKQDQFLLVVMFSRQVRWP